MGFCYANAPIKHGNYDKQMTSARRNVTLYGIKNCDTVRKTRKWLDARGIDYRYHDFREDGLTRQQVRDWLTRVEGEVLLNKRSTTWKHLDSGSLDGLDSAWLSALLAEHPTLIKRPVLEMGDKLSVGFSENRYRELFGQTEFDLRDRVHALGARVLETAADERQKKGRVRGS